MMIMIGNERKVPFPYIYPRKVVDDAPSVRICLLRREFMRSSFSSYCSADGPLRIKISM